MSFNTEDLTLLCYTKIKECHLIAMPGDKRIELKEQEKIANYSELKQEVKKIWNLPQVVVVPVVIGALGVTSKRLKDWLEKLNVKTSIDLLQKAALLGTWSSIAGWILLFRKNTRTIN